jgi:hypothetical protein
VTQDLPTSSASLYIQFKGTDICMDFRCSCGLSAHHDGYGAYVLRCTGCGSFYDMETSFVIKARDEEPLSAVNVWDEDQYPDFYENSDKYPERWRAL